MGKKRELPRTAASSLAAKVAGNAADEAVGKQGGVIMRFLLRLGFWLTVVLVLLPSGGSQPTPKVNVSAVEAMSAAGAAVSDVKGFCGRQAGACAVGSQVAHALGERAQAGAKMLYEFLSEQFGPSDTASIGKSAQSRPPRLHAAPPSQHTLTADDLAPPWRGPLPQRNPRRGGPA
jgi:hypothetical protein